MNRSDLEKYLFKLAKAEPNFPINETTAVYSVDEKMFALLETDKKTIVLSLRCDPKLAEVLKEGYEEVMTPHKLNKDKWIRIVLSGQLKQSEIEGLIDHSYTIVSNETD